MISFTKVGAALAGIALLASGTAATADVAGGVTTFRLIAERSVQAGDSTLNVSVYRGLGNGQFVTRVIPRLIPNSRDSFQLDDFEVKQVSSNTIYDIYKIKGRSVTFHDDVAGARCFGPWVGVLVNKISGRVVTSIKGSREGQSCTF